MIRINFNTIDQIYLIGNYIIFKSQYSNFHLS